LQTISHFKVLCDWDGCMNELDAWLRLLLLKCCWMDVDHEICYESMYGVICWIQWAGCVVEIIAHMAVVKLRFHDGSNDNNDRHYCWWQKYCCHQCNDDLLLSVMVGALTCTFGDSRYFVTVSSQSVLWWRKTLCLWPKWIVPEGYISCSGSVFFLVAFVVLSMFVEHVRTLQRGASLISV